MATYYIDPDGIDDAGRNGGIGQEWETLSWAISHVTNLGDIIHVNAGTYSAIPSQMLLSNQVSIIGDGRTLVTIPLTYSAGTPCIKLETWNGWENKSTVGHQTISGIKFVGSTTPGTPIAQACIGVNFRNSVEIHDCEFVDFVYSAAWFAGEPTYNGWTIDNPYETRVGEDSAYLPFSDSFCTGNRFYNNLVSNSCGLISSTMYSGELQVATQDGMLIYGNTMTALGRAGNANGVPIKLIHDVGFNRNVKIYNNNINAGHISTNYWQFAMEIWWDLGGLEIYDNVMNGSIDLCMQWDQYGAGYGAMIYDNDIGYTSTTTNLDYGIRLEDIHISCYIFRNKIHHVAIGITVNNANRIGAEVWDGIYIYDNLLVELSGNAYQTWGIHWDSEVVNHAALWRNCYIQHNTIVAKADAPDPTYYGIMLPTVEDFDGLYIENNILINWERGAIYGSGTRVQATNIYIRNNLIYDSYNSNDPVYVNSYPTAGITYSGTVKADPLFLSSTDYHLASAASPAYHAGRDLAIATDYDEVSFHATTPTIGAYEVTSASTIYYVRTDGNNANTGLVNTAGGAWATLSYACGIVSGASTIYVNAGSYAESSRCVLAPLVNIQGAGRATTIITFSYAASSFSDGCVYAVSSSVTDGNQFISDITFTTTAYASARGIYTRYRNNFVIHDVTVNGFDKSGINAYSEIDWVTPPTTFTTGFKVYSCTIENNTEAPDNGGECNLRFSGHEGFEIYNNTITSTSRVTPRSIYSSQVKNGRFYGNIVNTRESISGAWLFAMEMFNCRGGVEIDNNTFSGGGTIDLAGHSIQKGIYSYAISVHDNTMTLSSIVPYDATPTVGITIESWVSIESIYIYHNRITNFPWGINMTMGIYDVWGGSGVIEDIHIYSNIIENSASSDVSWNSFGVGIVQQASGVTRRNINIINNTITGNQTYSYRGVYISVDGTNEHINVKNNILEDFEYGVRLDNNSGTIHALELVNNQIYDCSTAVSIEAGTSMTDYVNTGQLTSNPLFVSSTDFHLQAGSPAYHSGIYIGTPYLYDYDNIAFYNPPSRGAFDGEEEPPAESLVGSTSGVSNAFGYLDDGVKGASIPDSLDFTLSDVCDIVEPSSCTLQQCFTYAIPSYFDPRYEGNHDRLSNFRNYGGEGAGNIGSLAGVVNPQRYIIIYGLLYNRQSLNDTRLICASGWHVPTVTELQSLQTYLGGSTVAGGKLKEIGTTYWNTPNTGATNEVGFNGRCGGYRGSYDWGGAFFSFKTQTAIWSLAQYVGYLIYTSASMTIQPTDSPNYGMAVRPLKDSTTLSHGQSGTYIGNDGTVYRTICIGTQEWVADNLAETEYRNGDSIEEITNANTWGLATTGAMCAYNNDWSNVYYFGYPTMVVGTLSGILSEALIGSTGGVASVSGALSEVAYSEEYVIYIGTGIYGYAEPSDSFVVVARGEDQTIYIYPEPGYQVAEVFIDSVSQGAIPSYTFINVLSDHTLSATFELTESNLDAGEIVGQYTARCNRSTCGSFSFSVSPSLGTGPYTYQWQRSNGTNDHFYSIGGAVYATWGGTVVGETIYIRCRVMDSVYAVAYTNEWEVFIYPPLIAGTICCAQTIDYGDTPDPITQATPSSGGGGGHTYYWQSIIEGGTWTTIPGATGTGYSPSALTQTTYYRRLTIDTVCGTVSSPSIGITVGAAVYHTITSSNGSGGSITPLGVIQVLEGADQGFAIAPSNGYHIVSVTVDGSNQGAITNYTFYDVITNHTISAEFALSPVYFSISSAASAGGTINPSGYTAVLQGGNQTFNFYDNTGYDIDYIEVDGVSQGALTQYTFYNVQDDHIIYAYFKVEVMYYTITSSAGAGGSINPLGVTQVAAGGGQYYSITDSVGYDIDYVLVNGTNMGAITEYQFSNVQQNQTIAAYFKVHQTEVIIQGASVVMGELYTEYQSTWAEARAYDMSDNTSPWYHLEGSVYIMKSRVAQDNYGTFAIGRVFISFDLAALAGVTNVDAIELYAGITATNYGPGVVFNANQGNALSQADFNNFSWGDYILSNSREVIAQGGSIPYYLKSTATPSEITEIVTNHFGSRFKIVILERYDVDNTTPEVNTTHYSNYFVSGEVINPGITTPILRVVYH